MKYIRSFEQIATEFPERLPGIVELMKIGVIVEFMGEGGYLAMEIVKFKAEELPCVPKCLTAPKKSTHVFN